MPGFLDVISAKLAKFVATRRRLSQFTCGDCEHWRRCGLTPTANCVARAAQVARGDWIWRRRASRLRTDAIGWWYPR